MKSGKEGDVEARPVWSFEQLDRLILRMQRVGRDGRLRHEPHVPME